MAERTVRLERVLDAPRARVFEAWTRAEHLEHWFGPSRFTVHSCETDPRPGGVFRLCMRSPDGKDYWVRGVFREVVAPERLVIACTAEDENGVPQLDELIRVAFAEEHGKTRLTLNASASGAGMLLEGMEKGWAQTVERLHTLLRR
jgi:uncharacterized protein YndB with AHSA1/START domain